MKRRKHLAPIVGEDGLLTCPKCAHVFPPRGTAPDTHSLLERLQRRSHNAYDADGCTVYRAVSMRDILDVFR